MIQRVLGIIAGVDRKTLESCPASDKLWAAHLGASLCLSFIVVLGVSYHASGYMIESVWTRLLVSSVIALTVLMFDRALCQSDWFYQGTLWNTSAIQSRAEAKQTAWRFVRVGIRLTLSFGLAWVIAMFLELAIFSGTINEKIEADRVAANQPIYEKIAAYEAQQAAEIRRRLVADRGVEAMARTLRKPLPEDVDFMHATRDEMVNLRKAIYPLTRKLAARLARKRGHRRARAVHAGGRAQERLSGGRRGAAQRTFANVDARDQSIQFDQLRGFDLARCKPVA